MTYLSIYFTQLSVKFFNGSVDYRFYFIDVDLGSYCGRHFGKVTRKISLKQPIVIILKPRGINKALARRLYDNPAHSHLI